MDSHEHDKHAFKRSPQDTASFVSRVFVWWILPLLRKGSVKDLEAENVYLNRAENGSAKLGGLFEKAWNKEVRLQQGKGEQRPKMWRAMKAIIGRKYALCCVASAFDAFCLRSTQPILLREFIATFNSGDSLGNLSTQIFYATALILVTCFHLVFYEKIVEAVAHLGIQLRLGLSSLIYRKVLKLRKSDTDQANVGKIVTLMSNDVRRFEWGLVPLPFFFIAPVQLILLGTMLWRELGVASLGGIGCILVTLPIQVCLGRISMYFRTRVGKRTEERGRFLNEVIGGIRLIKMYAWETPFAHVVDKLRRAEISFIRRQLYLRGAYLGLKAVATKLVPFSALAFYVFLGNSLTAEKAFFTITVLSTMMEVVMSKVAAATATGGELLASLERIEDFLLSPEKVSQEEQTATERKWDEVDRSVCSVKMENFSASWSCSNIDQSAATTLQNLNVNVKGNKLVVVVGKVGAGKTSFLNAILGELPLVTNGHLEVRGSFSYASQEAWIFPGTFRQNILFGLEMNDGRYWEIIELCSLTDDLREFPDRDQTLVGERGVSLSGGQKARVNLARALYQDADLYLLDDPLSAVDNKVSQHLFTQCFQRFLDGKLRILATHQLQYLPFADHIIVLNQDGSIKCQGTYDRLKSSIDFNTLASETYLHHHNLSVTHNIQSITTSTLQNNQQPTIIGNKSSKDAENGITTDHHATHKFSTRDEEKKVGSVGLGVYLRYFRSGGSTLKMATIVVTYLLAQLLFNCIDYWLSLWSANFDGNSMFHIHIYFRLVASFAVVITVRSLTFFSYCMQTSVNLHNAMFASLVRAPVQFFDDNPSGRIMNRFTTDLNKIDEYLPLTLNDSVGMILSVSGMLVISVATNPWSVVPAVIFVTSLWKLRSFYLPTARALKRMESIAKSPLFTHLSMTVQGQALPTIRAMKAESRVLYRFNEIQDSHTSAYYLMFMVNRWFSIWLQLISVGFLATVCFGFLMLTGSESGGVGVTISTILGVMGAIMWGIRESTETENYMTSVERVFEYSDLKPEASLETPDDEFLEDTWPSQGVIEFEDVSLSYGHLKENQVLRDITFVTKPKEKIGIVGRTGAGKSSLATALFRLTEPGGVLRIDGIPIKDLGLHSLRSKISVIPQDPVLFTGSLRYNLDPFTEFSDEQLWHALREVELHPAVPSLNFQVADGGSNFSTGQRQLVCFARAILRKNKILILDEATANVDPATDQLIQQKIRNTFSHCTILTIAHRLDTVLDYDRILVLDKGHIVEFDTPKNLLRNSGSVLSQLLRFNATSLAAADEQLWQRKG